MDKINRLEKPVATEGTIKYGDGNVYLKPMERLLLLRLII